MAGMEGKLDNLGMVMERWLGYFFVGVIILLLLCWLKAVRTKQVALFKDVIEPIVREQGYTLVSITIPEKLDSGPFPQPNGTVSHLGAIMFMDYGVFRIVRFQDKDEIEYMSWARLLFNGSNVEDVEWMPDFQMIREEKE